MFICDLKKTDDPLDHLDRDVKYRVYTRLKSPRLGERNVSRFRPRFFREQETDAVNLIRAVVFQFVNACPLGASGVCVMPDNENRFHHFSFLRSWLKTGA